MQYTMSKQLSQYIIRLRKEKSLSQEYLAEKLNISRPTYMQIEKGERELTVSEAKKLSAIFSLSLEDFLNMVSPTEYQVFTGKNQTKKKTKKTDIRINVPQKNLEKFRQVLLYILDKVGAKANIGETALYKLLYFIDFDYYEKYEEQLIGATYIKNHYGPTPIEFKKIIDQMEKQGQVEAVKSKYFQYEQKKYLPRTSPDLSCLSGQELALIDDVLHRLSDKSAKELSEYSHGDIPWKTHDDGEKIDYESVFYRDDKYSVREYDDKL